MANNSILRTPRLALRELTPDDLDFVGTMLAHPEVNRYYEKDFTRLEAQAWLERQLERYRNDGHGLWLVLEHATGEPVGQVGLVSQDVGGRRQPEVGWLLHRPYWGRGYATEAAAGTRDLARSRWHYGRLISLIRPVNLPSQRVAERIGMHPGPRVEFHGFEHIVYETEPEPRTPPNQCMKLARGGARLKGKGSILIAAPASRSLCAIR